MKAILRSSWKLPEKRRKIERQQYGMEQKKDRCFYAFLQADREEKLTILLCNYLSLSQFELARATLHELAVINPNKALGWLKQLVFVGPPSDWYLNPPHCHQT